MRRFIRLLLLLGFYLLLAGVLTWPLLKQINNFLPDGTDTLLHYWNDWWVWEAFTSGESPYFTPYLFHPNGLSMVYNNFALVHILGFGVLRPFFGQVAAYNLVYLVNLALCGVSAYWLAKTLTGDSGVAFVAGIIYQAWPHRMTQPSHPNLMSTWPIPLFLLFLYRTTQTRRWRDAIAVGLMLALVGYMRWQLLIPATLMGGIFLLFLLWRNMDKQVVMLLLGAGLIAVIALLPPVVLLVNTWQDTPTDFVLAGEELRMQTDLAAYLTPPDSHTFFKRFTQSLYETYYPDRGSRSRVSPYLGLFALALVVVGIVKSPRRQMLPWLSMAVVLLLLALGPTLRVFGVQFSGVPMFYEMVGQFFVVRLLREPDRFNTFLALPVAMLAAYGLLALWQYDWWLRHRKVLVSGLSLLIVLDFLVIPLPLQATAVSPIFSQLAKEESDSAVLNIHVNPYKSKPYMFAQVTHERPILQGHSSRYPQGAFSYLENQPWLHAMLLFDQIPPKFPDLSRQMTDLAADGVGTIVIHKTQIAEDYWADWRNYFIMPPLYEDEAVMVYTTSPEADVDYHFSQEMVHGLGVVQMLPAAACVNPGSVWALDVGWGTAVSITEEFSVNLNLVDNAGAIHHSQTFPISSWTSSEWLENTLAWGYYALTIPEDVAPGEYTVEMSLTPTNSDWVFNQSETVSFPLTVSEAACENATLPETAEPLDLRFGSEMRLLAYETNLDEANLALTLYWQGQQRMNTDYKVFVHFFDVETGQMVAQNDAMPRDWSYPTTFWPPGKLVDDEVTLPLDGLVNGRYTLAVGLYNPQTGERLPVVDSNGEPVPDNRPLLRTIKLDRVE